MGLVLEEQQGGGQHGWSEEQSDVRALVNSAGAARAGQRLGKPLLQGRLEGLTARKSKAQRVDNSSVCFQHPPRQDRTHRS